jgi:hypothetical protein
MSLTYQQVLALAPDDASAKAGVQLANPANWVFKAAHPLALWGDCQGSGKNPYKTYIDLSQVAFKCSCPSRKFPCKHGLGLFLMFARQPEVFIQETTLPAELDAWLNKRQEKAQPKEQKPVDEKARQKREQSRENKITAGIDELQVWLKDVARTGIQQVPQHAYEFNKHMVARLVDSQAPGLASQLRKINHVDFYQEGWQEGVLKIIAKTYVMADAYRYKEEMDEGWKAELETLIGWTQAKEDILQLPPVEDDWMVLSTTETREDALTTESVWLYGLHSKKFALILSFFAGNQRPMDVWTAGRIVHASVCFYPSVVPQRALVKSKEAFTNATLELPGFLHWEEVKEELARVYSLSPFVERIPFLFNQCRVIYNQSIWYLLDVDSTAMRLLNTREEGWNILAITKGNPFHCFGILEHNRVKLHSLVFENKFYSLV